MSEVKFLDPRDRTVVTATVDSVAAEIRSLPIDEKLYLATELWKSGHVRTSESILRLVLREIEASQ